MMGRVTSSKFAPLRRALGPLPEVSPEGSGADFFGASFVMKFIGLKFEFGGRLSGFFEGGN